MQTKDAVTSYLDAISMALHDSMQEDPSVVLYGQDIAAYGGAFKITKGLSEKFGTQRVINTPIAESGTVGMAIGAALLGQRPVVEMQFADFVSCCFNQIANVAAKMFYRTEQAVPMVIRLPYGAGVGAGPFHSQSMESWFLHIPGLKVVAPSTAEDAYIMLREAIKDPNPVLFFEHKFLYRRQKSSIHSPQIDSQVNAKVHCQREGKDISLITYGWMVHRALEAAEILEAEGIDLEVIDLRSLAPLDKDGMLESVKKCGKVMLLHEATLTGGFGGELAAIIADEAIDYLDGPIRRIASKDTPMPFHKQLEAEVLPSVENILTQARELHNW